MFFQLNFYQFILFVLTRIEISSFFCYGPQKAPLMYITYSLVLKNTASG